MRKMILIAAVLSLIGAPAFAEDAQSAAPKWSLPEIPLVLGPPALAADAGATKEYMRVTFLQAVRLQDVWLLGTYVFEHDKDRMARGEPCTHIYKINDRTKPILAFHCEHLDRPAVKEAKVALRREGFSADAYRVTEFQFAGSTEGHGVPKSR